MEKDRFLTTKEVAKLLGTTIQHIYWMIGRREINHYKFGSRKLIRFRESDILDFVQNSFRPAIARER